MKDTNVFRPTGGGVPTARTSLNRAPLLVFALCLLAGAFVIYRHAHRAAGGARARAQTETAARAVAVEMELRSACSATDVLGALVRQAGGLPPGFQSTAAQLLADHPGVISLALQPAGVTADIAPRAGNERAIRVNVFNDPVSRSGALLAMQTHQPTSVGPLPLAQGGLGLITRVPVYFPGRDGREAFWGFVSATIRLTDVAHRARLDGLLPKGYEFMLFSPERGTQAAVVVAWSGGGMGRDYVQQVISVQGCELRLAVRPKAGWYDWRDIGVWFVGVLLMAAVLAVLVRTLSAHSETAAALQLANRQSTLEKQETAKAKAENARLLEQATRAGDQSALDKAQLVQATAQLAQANAQANREREELVQANEELAREIEQLTARQAQLLAERDQLTQSNQQLLQDKEALAASQELTALAQQELTRVHEQLLRTRDQLAKANSQLASELEQLTRSHEQSVQDLQELRETNAQLGLDNEQLRREKEVLAQVSAQAALDQEQIKLLNEQLNGEQEIVAKAREQLAEVDEQAQKSAQRIEELEQRLAAALSQPAPPSGDENIAAPEVIAEAPIGEAPSLSPPPPPSAKEPDATPEIPQPSPRRDESGEVPEQGSHEPPRGFSKTGNGNKKATILGLGKFPGEFMAGEQVRKEQEPSPETATSESSEPPWSTEEGETSSQIVPPAHLEEPPSPPPQPPPHGNKDVAAPVPADQASVGEAASLPPPPPSDDKPVPAPVELKPAIRTKPPRQKKIKKDDQMSLFGEAPAAPPAPAPAADLLSAEPPAPSAPPPPPVAEAEPATVTPPTEPARPSAPPPAPAPVEPEPPAVVPPTEPSPPPVAEPHPELPDIQGLDTSAGLAHTDGHTKPYLKLLRQFASDRASSAERVRDLLVQGQPAQAEHLASALKDAAQDIGAVTLQATAHDLERAIKAQADPADIESLWSTLDQTLSILVADLKLALKPKEEKPKEDKPAERPPPPVDPPVLRRAVNEILPLLTDLDPGAADCLKANRKTFRSAFSVDGFAEFEQHVKAGAYHEALDLLKKAAKKHGAIR